MKKILTIMLLATVVGAALAQTKEIYTNPEFTALAKDHKVLAILPFHVVMDLRPKQRQSMSDEQYEQLLKAEGLAVQSALESYFLKRKEKHDLAIQFQNASKTNSMLKKQGISEENLKDYSPDELAEILGVDAVITGTFHTSKPMSEGAALALGMALGVFGPTNSGKVTININDGKEGDLLWKYEKTLSRSYGSDTNTIINTMMRKASRKFPYKAI